MGIKESTKKSCGRLVSNCSMAWSRVLPNSSCQRLYNYKLNKPSVSKNPGHLRYVGDYTTQLYRDDISYSIYYIYHISKQKDTAETTCVVLL